MRSIITCVGQQHDHKLILLAACVCTLGVYATFAVSMHARRSQGRDRRFWAIVSVVATGCTAWATHFIALLAFRPGVPSGFEPVLTAVSLLAATALFGIGVAVAFSSKGKIQSFVAGTIVGIGVAVLHYIGQAAYVVVADVSWDWTLVVSSVLASVVIAGSAFVALPVRAFGLRRLAVPLLLASIALLHFCGMSAETIVYNPRLALPADAISPEAIAPVVAGVCIGLLLLAIIGFKFSLDAKARWRRDRQRLSELANVALEGLMICDGEAIVTVNESFERLSGYDGSALAGRSAGTLLSRMDLAGLPELEEREGELAGAGGQIVPVRVLRREVVLGHGRHTVFAIRDQRERLRTEATIRTLAYEDALTRLPNRARFHDLLAVHCASRQECDRSFAVCIIDLDRLKRVNEMLGWAAGGQLLRQVADRLAATVRGDDVLARLGGDEFVVLQKTLRDDLDAAALARRCVEAVSRPFAVAGQILHVGASVGIAMAPDDGDEPAGLLHRANLALEAATAEGGGAVRIYAPELDARIQERRRLEAGLRRAIEAEEFEVHYQPLMNARTQSLASAEALVRWRDPIHGLVPPAHFIPLAEETGLIVPIGNWVLRTACIEAATWPQGMSVAVNLSPVQFRDPSLVEDVKRALADAALAPDRLELEITEGMLMSDEARVLDTLTRLRAEGVRIAMDDFGTGYSSLSYLRRFPFDKIKVDQSFIRQLPHDPESSAIVRAIVTMGRGLGIATTVEGVETPEQLAFATDEGCDFIQGYLFSRPLPQADLKIFISKVESHNAIALEVALEPA